MNSLSHGKDEQLKQVNCSTVFLVTPQYAVTCLERQFADNIQSGSVQYVSDRRPPFLRDHLLAAFGAVLQGRFYCTTSMQEWRNAFHVKEICFMWNGLNNQFKIRYRIHSDSSALSVSKILSLCMMMDSKSHLKSMHFFKSSLHLLLCAKSLMMKGVSVY